VAVTADLMVSERSEPKVGRARYVGAVVAVVGWVALIGYSYWLGRHIHDRARLQLGNTPPLLGARRFETWQLWPAIAVSVLLLGLVPYVKTLRFRALLVVSWVAAAAWTTSVAATDGLSAIPAPMRRANEYRAALPALDHGPAHFLRTYTSALPGYPTQVKGHPPLPVLVLWAWEKVGFHGPGWSAALVIAVGTSSVVAVAITVKALTDADQARRLLPFLVLAPATAWLATSMDAFFVGVAAWAVTLATLAAGQARRSSALAFGIAAGLLLGCLPYLSYGLLPFAVIAAVAFVSARRLAHRAGNLPPAHPAISLAATIASAAGVAAIFTVAGFWWPAGVRATHQLYLHTYGSGTRPYNYFLLGNLAVAALMIGPAVTVALTRRGRPKLLTAVLAATLLAVIVSDISGYTRGEVERIWLPYAPWLLVAAANLVPRRGILAAQILTALAVQSLVLSPW
jgi:hypothetical protein